MCAGTYLTSLDEESEIVMTVQLMQQQNGTSGKFVPNGRDSLLDWSKIYIRRTVTLVTYQARTTYTIILGQQQQSFLGDAVEMGNTKIVSSSS